MSVQPWQDSGEVGTPVGRIGWVMVELQPAVEVLVRFTVVTAVDRWLMAAVVELAGVDEAGDAEELADNGGTTPLQSSVS